MAQEQQEYAPRYSLQERIKHAVVGVVCVSIFLAIWEWWALPQWIEFARTAHCRTVLGISGSRVALYGMFVGVPLTIAICLGAAIVPSALRSIRARQYPPPGKKVHGKVRIRTGRTAIVSAAGDLVLIGALVAIAVWGSLQVPQILGESKPRSDPNCFAVRSESPKANASLDGEAMRKETLSAGDTR